MDPSVKADKRKRRQKRHVDEMKEALKKFRIKVRRR